MAELQNNGQENVGTGNDKNAIQDNNRTFTQAQLDEIVKERLKKEKEKYADYEALKEKASKYDEQEEAQKSELQKATEKAAALEAQVAAFTKANEVRGIREKIAKETGVPATLLTADTEEECKIQAQGILAFAQPGTYPEVNDGGEVQHINSKKVEDQFADWFAAVTK